MMKVSSSLNTIIVIRGIVKKEYLVIILGLFSPVLHKKHMLWVLIRSTSHDMFLYGIKKNLSRSATK